MYLTLQTKRLILRPFKLEDSSKMYENWASDEEVTKYLTWDAHENVDVTKSIVENWVSQYKKEERINCAITLKDSGELIGGIDVVGYLDGIPVIGYCLSRKYWNKGYMSEACQCLLNYLFKIGHKLVIIDAVDENIGSNKVIKKCHGKFINSYNDTQKGKPVIINRYHVEQTSIFITAGECMYNALKNNENIYIPFNEALINLKEPLKLFTDDFIKQRILDLNTTKEEYLSKMSPFFDFINNIYLYNQINLMFGDEPFCLTNLISILAYLEGINYQGEVIYYKMDEINNIIIESNKLELVRYIDKYYDLCRLSPLEKEDYLKMCLIE